MIHYRKTLLVNVCAILCFTRSAKIVDAFGELTLTLDVADIIKSCLQLRDTFLFDTLIDLSGVDYLTYGQSEWDANASSSGFGRAREAQDGTKP
jgi:NADH-quinone oxidoreductase subunit C